jgi:uncharacterized protein (TIGR03083 family)
MTAETDAGVDPLDAAGATWASSATSVEVIAMRAAMNRKFRGFRMDLCSRSFVTERCSADLGSGLIVLASCERWFRRLTIDSRGDKPFDSPSRAWQAQGVELSRYIDNLEHDLNFIKSVANDLTLPVPTCPGWDLGRLVGHLGRVHRMALAVLTTGSMKPAPSDQLEAPPADHDQLRAYFSTSSEQLVSTLRSIDPEFPCWTFLGEPHNAAFWIRRQAHEHAIHRFDAESATTGSSTPPIPTDIAIDGINEYFLIQNLRALPNKPDFELGGSLHLHATDDTADHATTAEGAGEWMIVHQDAMLQVTNEHGKGDAAIRGSASDLLLGLWGRRDLVGGSEFERFGSTSVISTLASLGGT